MARETIEQLGAIDVLVANAGYPGPAAPAWEMPEEVWDQRRRRQPQGRLAHDARGRAAHDRAPPGRIIMTSSRNGLRAEAYCSAYVAAKHGVIGYMKALALELGPHRINVNAICPTSMGDAASSGTRGGTTRRASRAPRRRTINAWCGSQDLFEKQRRMTFEVAAQTAAWLVDATRPRPSPATRCRSTTAGSRSAVRLSDVIRVAVVGCGWQGTPAPERVRGDRRRRDRRDRRSVRPTGWRRSASRFGIAGRAAADLARAAHAGARARPRQRRHDAAVAPGDHASRPWPPARTSSARSPSRARRRGRADARRRPPPRTVPDRRLQHAPHGLGALPAPARRRRHARPPRRDLARAASGDADPLVGAALHQGAGGRRRRRRPTPATCSTWRSGSRARRARHRQRRCDPPLSAKARRHGAEPDAAARYDVEDTAGGFIRLEDGGWLQLELAWTADLPDPVIGVELHFERGWARLDPLCVMVERDGDADRRHAGRRGRRRLGRVGRPGA